MRGIKSKAGYIESVENDKKLRVSGSISSNKSSDSAPVDGSVYYNPTRSSLSDLQYNTFERETIISENESHASGRISNEVDMSGSKPDGSYVEAVIPNVRKFLNLINSLKVENSSKRYMQSNKFNDAFIYFRFTRDNISIHHISESKSLYTCLILQADQFLGYNIYTKNGDLTELEFTLDFHTIIISLITFNPNSAFKLLFDSNCRYLVLEEVATKRVSMKGDNQQCIICRIKTLQSNSFDIPIDIVKIANDSNYRNDNVSIYSNYLYSCIYDITSDSSTGKLVLAITPDDDSLNSVLAMAKSQPTISTQWNFRLDSDIFVNFNVKSKHEYYYSIRSWAQITRGIKNSRLVNILIQSNGILLLEVECQSLNNKIEFDKPGYKIYYYLYPIT